MIKIGQIDWEQQEKGWWTCNLGGVCLEGDGKWYFYPCDSELETIGPFNTLVAAKLYAESVQK